MPRIAFVSLFPDMIRAAMGEGILHRASESGLVDFAYANPRDFTHDRHRTVDDSPFGGEPGMLMKAEPVALAIESLKPGPDTVLIIPDPVAPMFRQADANSLSRVADVLFVCGRYEGIDDRIATHFAARRYSIGDFVVTGGELPAALLADAIIRQLPGVLGNEASLIADSFSAGLLSAPNYTRPEVWRDIRVPEVLISGHHAEIAKWRRRESLLLTMRYRPDMLKDLELTESEREWLSGSDTL